MELPVYDYYLHGFSNFTIPLLSLISSSSLTLSITVLALNASSTKLTVSTTYSLTLFRASSPNPPPLPSHPLFPPSPLLSQSSIPPPSQPPSPYPLLSPPSLFPQSAIRYNFGAFQETPSLSNSSPPSLPPPAPPFAPPPFYSEDSPANADYCEECAPGYRSWDVDSLSCTACPLGYNTLFPRSKECTPCPPGLVAQHTASSVCHPCLIGTYSPTQAAAVCTLCPTGFTTSKVGLTYCDFQVDLYRLRRVYAVLLRFTMSLELYNYTLTMTGLPRLVGLNGTALNVVAQLIRVDTAAAFNISINDVLVEALESQEEIFEMMTSNFTSNSSRLNPRTLLVTNVTAVLEAHVSEYASEGEVDAALLAKEMSADGGIQMLTDDPDRFFGRTTQALNARAQTIGNITTEVVHPDNTSKDTAFWDNVENILGLSVGILFGSAIIIYIVRRYRQWYLRKRLLVFTVLEESMGRIPDLESETGNVGTNNNLRFDSISSYLRSRGDQVSKRRI